MTRRRDAKKSWKDQPIIDLILETGQITVGFRIDDRIVGSTGNHNAGFGWVNEPCLDAQMIHNHCDESGIEPFTVGLESSQQIFIVWIVFLRQID